MLIRQTEQDDNDRVMPFLWLRYLGWFVLAVMLGALGLFVIHALPPRHLVIETGPQQGSYYAVAQEYAKRFAAYGITLDLRPRDDSLAMIADVNNPDSDVDIGFIAQSVQAAAFPNVTTLGSISYQPLFIFYRKSLGNLAKPAALKGLRLELLAESSATSAAATVLLNAYGIDDTNTTLQHHRLAEAVQHLLDGGSDAAFLMLSVDNPVITRLMSDPDLELMSLEQSAAIAQRFPFLKPLSLAHGVYSLQEDRPADDVKVVAATVDVIVRKTTPPAIVYLLMQFMTDLRGQASSLAGGEEFPAVKNAQLPVNEFAQVYYQGGMPWANRRLPLSLASLADTFLVFLLPLFVLLPFGQWLGMPALLDTYNLLRTAAWTRVLRQIERDVDNGKPLTPQQIERLHRIERTMDPLTVRKYRCIAIADRIRKKHAGE